MYWRWVWCVYPLFVVAGSMVSLLQRGTFFKRRGAEPQKGPAKRLAPPWVSLRSTSLAALGLYGFTGHFNEGPAVLLF
jgi:hypothetical protein